MNRKDRIINGLYGLAVADAVGNPFEFQCGSEFTPNDVIAYANDSDILVVSDDTQMTAYGFEAMSKLDNYGTRLSKQVEYAFSDAYVDWYFTQTFNGSKDYDCGLSSFPEMWSVQSPGNICLSSLSRIYHGNLVENNSMGCGSVMRLLPLLLFPQLSVSIEMGLITGNITHHHERSDSAIREYLKFADRVISGERLDGVYSSGHVSDFGEGWIAPECVEMAIWCYRTATSFDDLLRRSIHHSGDSDSVAAVAGSLWGLSGKEVPIKYINKLDAILPLKYCEQLINDY